MEPEGRNLDDRRSICGFTAQLIDIGNQHYAVPDRQPNSSIKPIEPARSDCRLARRYDATDQGEGEIYNDQRRVTESSESPKSIQNRALTDRHRANSRAFARSMFSNAPPHVPWYLQADVLLYELRPPHPHLPMSRSTTLTPVHAGSHFAADADGLRHLDLAVRLTESSRSVCHVT